jgi:hypothetical protein
MKVTRILAALALVVGFAGTAHAQHGCARLSWGTCDPQVQDKAFTTATPYLMVYSIFQSPDGNVGTDSQIRIRNLGPGGVQMVTPDAWRFDDVGCQTGSQLTLTSNKALSKACPLYSGLNPLTITQFAQDVDGSMFCRLAITYDNFIPNPALRYTAWQILFDHTFSVAGPSTPLQTCGGAELCENFSFDFAGVLGLTGIQYNIPNCDLAPAGTPANTEATWNGGCQGPVATLPATWGKVKGMYH